MSEQSKQAESTRPTSRRATRTRRVQTLMRKGGAGKTTTAVNLAEALGRLGYRVLTVDLDANASLTKLVGLRLPDLEHSLYDLLMSPAGLLATRNVIHQPAHLSFDVLPGSENLGYAEPSLLMARRQNALAERLAEVEDDYDFVLLDTAGHESFMHTLGHVYADEAILPTEADIANWETLETTLGSVRKVRESGLNPNIQVKAILVTRYQQGTNYGTAMLQKLVEQYRELLFPLVVPQTVRAKEAQGYRTSIVAYDPDSTTAQVYVKLAEFLADGQA